MSLEYCLCSSSFTGFTLAINYYAAFLAQGLNCDATAVSTQCGAAVILEATSGHRGSGNGTDEELMEAMTPKISVLSTGIHTQHGFHVARVREIQLGGMETAVGRVSRSLGTAGTIRTGTIWSRSLLAYLIAAALVLKIDKASLPPQWLKAFIVSATFPSGPSTI